jgi:quercetin dioxygenase-like cupin family protein
MAQHGDPGARREGETKTEGAIRGGGGRFVFDLARLATIDAGPGYSTAHGPVVEGERMQVGLLRMPRGTGGRPHSHPNEQWVYVLKGTLESEVDGVKAHVPAGSLMYIPAHVVHSALATPDEDVVFLTVKDMSHGIVGTPVDQSISAPLYAPGFGPSGATGESRR